jgi:hypothetical protein
LGKLAVISAELVDECFAHSDGAVAEELLQWFREAVAVLWVKEVKKVVVKSFYVLSRATWCVRKYPISELVRKHRNSRKCSCLRFFSGFSVFSWLCIFCAFVFCLFCLGKGFMKV